MIFGPFGGLFSFHGGVCFVFVSTFYSFSKGLIFNSSLRIIFSVTICYGHKNAKFCLNPLFEKERAHWFKTAIHAIWA